MQDTFFEIFSDYAKEASYEFYPFDRSSLKLIDTGSHQGHPTATFGVHYIDCLGFQQFLVGSKSHKYNLRSVQVKCPHMEFSLCYAFDCDVKDVPNTTHIAPAGWY
ncbi:hypothetical protein OESDEN_13634 [Oesophagostomum dentatum]|uniref:Uncharacterized protein n=1 Tax=Oesophagostomum dentatum TaxID=61180 RepID=A0A0B1SSY3_OESDE|nr:hypothetical protein OESDEN_13634 [Oesophagostomum dentatum]